MVGPSSSHTAGAVRIGLAVGNLLGGTPESARITLCGSFAATGRGHGTHMAIVAGLLGIPPDDPGVRDSIARAADAGLQLEITTGELPAGAHPNTAVLEVERAGRRHTVVASSTGGGSILISEIDGFPVEIDCRSSAIVIRNEDRPGMIAAMAEVLSKAALNISYMHNSRIARSGVALTTFTLDGEVPPEALFSLAALDGVLDALEIPGFATTRFEPPEKRHESPGMDSMSAWLEFSARKDVPAGDVVLLYEEGLTGASRDEITERLRRILDAMRHSLEEAPPARTPITGMPDVATRISSAPRKVVSAAFAKVMSDAASVASLNAGMGVIAAAPTAGAAGILPAVLFNVARETGAGGDTIEEALLVAAGVGLVIRTRASLSGAEAGCQAECGAASAMASAAAVVLGGGSGRQVESAATIALKNSLGLVCDPVAGAVEVPCIKRNAIFAVVALAAAEMALADVESLIPFDEVVDAMAGIGRDMPASLKEKSEGGLACTLTGRRIARKAADGWCADGRSA